MATNQWFTVIDDEASQIGSASQPVWVVAQQFLTPEAQAHPPLPDILLHYWIDILGSHIRNVNLLRLLPISYFLVGIFLLSNAADRVGGRRAGDYVLLLCVLWPYGFHFGRISTWFSFAFLTTAWAVDSYFAWFEQPRSIRRVAVLTLASLGLLYTTYVGCACLAFLGLDLWMRTAEERRTRWKTLVAILSVASLAYIPGFVALLQQLRSPSTVNPPQSGIRAFGLGFFNLYVLFASESIAPWLWPLSIPIGMAILLILFIMTFRSTPRTRLMFIFAIGMVAVLTFLGVANAKRVITLAPWLILSVALTFAKVPSGALRSVLLYCFVAVATVGWMGIISRRYYATQRFAEPWLEVGQQMANEIRAGSMVIGNHPSFFYYLTLALQEETSENNRFRGVITHQIERHNVYDPELWMRDGQKTAPTVFLVAGVSMETEMNRAQMSLENKCLLKRVNHLLRDPGVRVKRRFFPDVSQPEWRVEVRSYKCGQ